MSVLITVLVVAIAAILVFCLHLITEVRELKAKARGDMWMIEHLRGVADRYFDQWLDEIHKHSECREKLARIGVVIRGEGEAE